MPEDIVKLVLEIFLTQCAGLMCMLIKQAAWLPRKSPGPEDRKAVRAPKCNTV
jgi:hypothetical protein